MKRALVYDEEHGFLPEIEALLNPKGHKKSDTRKYKAAPIVKWKGVNTQFCIVCREGGEILCCEGCPASFHLLCHTPPILKSAIPSGKWFCHRCSSLSKYKDAPKSNIQQNPDETEAERNEMATNFVFAMATDEEKDDPIKLMTDASKVRNTQNFTLPDEIDPKIPLPHTQLSKPRAAVKNKNCTKCGSVKAEAPMIECDYCVSPYHLDCLDSPMTVSAKMRWMCPQHPEHVVDKNLLQSNSLSERLELWEDFAGSDVEPEESISQFVRKSREEAAAAGGPREKRVKVPQAIKRLYAQRAEVDNKELFATAQARDEYVQEMAVMMGSAVSTRLTGIPFEVEDKEGPFLKRECIRRMRECTDDQERLLYSLALDRIQAIELETAVVEEKKVKPKLDTTRLHPNRLILGVIARESDPSAAVPIQKAVVTVGKGKGADVKVISVCKNIASNHATIVFDRMTHRFEVLPYSTHVVRVDEIDYGLTIDVPLPNLQKEIIENDSAERPYTPPPGEKEVKDEPMEGSSAPPSVPKGVPMNRCTCHLRKREGRVSQAAQLKHGSIIEIGCERFVFASFF